RFTPCPIGFSIYWEERCKPYSGRDTSYKKATFSMSTVAIDELGNLTQQDGMNKSLLLRLFTHYFSSLTPEERQTIYERLNQRS
ncbi:hypothetical protein ACK36K_16905, partial [Aeromonas veronii]